MAGVAVLVGAARLRIQNAIQAGRIEFLNAPAGVPSMRTGARVQTIGVASGAIGVQVQRWQPGDESKLEGRSHHSSMDGC
jgi:hypothetical protein